MGLKKFVTVTGSVLLAQWRNKDGATEECSGVN